MMPLIGILIIPTRGNCISAFLYQMLLFLKVFYLMHGGAKVLLLCIEKGRERNHIPDGCAFFQVQGGYDEEKLSGIYKKSMKIAGQGIVARIEELGKERELSDQELAMHDMFVNGKGDPASWDISEIVSYFSE